MDGTATGKPCVFFDRDGIVNRYPGAGKYVERLEDFHLQPEFLSALRVAANKGYEAVLVTNQRGVALGRMTMEAVQSMHDHLAAVLEGEGLRLLEVMICPHNDDAHPHRKPNPGMILDAAAKHHLDLSRSWMVGDSEGDAEAGRRAGCKTVLVSSKDQPTVANYRLAHIRELAGFLEEHL